MTPACDLAITLARWGSDIAHQKCCFTHRSPRKKTGAAEDSEDRHGLHPHLASSGDELVQGMDWVPIKVYGKLAEIAVKYLDKGSHVSIEARLKSWQQTKNGNTRYGMDVVANDILFLDAKEQVASPEEQAPVPGHGEATVSEPEDIPF